MDDDQIEYTIEEESQNNNINNNKMLFEMDKANLIVAENLHAGTFDIKIRAQLFSYKNPSNSKRYATAYHSIHIVIMNDRDKYPVFPQLNYLLKVGPFL